MTKRRRGIQRAPPATRVIIRAEKLMDKRNVSCTNRVHVATLEEVWPDTIREPMKRLS